MWNFLGLQKRAYPFNSAPGYKGVLVLKCGSNKEWYIYLYYIYIYI